MKKDFDIQLLKLKNGKHSFEYAIDKRFFDLFEGSSLQDGKLLVLVELEKNEATNVLNFSLNGNINLECDRCLDEIDYPAKGKYTLTVKVSDMEKSDVENVIIVPSNDQRINVADIIYEMIHLSLPLKKTCKEIDKECNEEVISKLANLQDGDDKGGEDTTDPRWDKLKELLN